MKDINGKIERYRLLVERKPKYYALIGDLFMDDGDFENACSYYREAIEKGVLAYTALGDALDLRNMHKKSLDAYAAGAEEGETECLVRLGSCYLNGRGVKKDPQKAIEYYAKASEKGSSEAARTLGDICYFEALENGNVRKALEFYERAFCLGDIEVTQKIGFIYLNDETLRDVPKAIEWYEKGLSLGDHSLDFDLACVYLNDRFVPHDYEKGLKYLLEGVEHNDPDSLYLYARSLETGMYGVELDRKAYLQFLKKAAKLGKDDALLELGYHYCDKGKYDDALDCFARCELDCDGLYWCMATIYEAKKADYKNALFYYEMAMKTGFPDAIERMAEAYLGDELGLEKDEKAALRLFKRAARLGNSEAQYNLGMAYANGWYGLIKDEKKAVRWLKKSVNSENPWACLQMGLHYYYAIKTDTACKKAFDLFKKAYALGEERALVNIGICCLEGKGTKKNEKEAAKCFKTAAERFHSGVAYRNLGVCYENGWGVRRDFKKAIRMYGKAAEYGETTSVEKIKNAYLKMSEMGK